MKKIILLTLITFSFGVFSQDVAFERKNFPNQKKELKEAVKELKEAEKLMQPNPVPKYSTAVEHYLKAHQFNPNNAQVNYQIGVCYLNTAQKFRSLAFFQKAFDLNAQAFDDIYYYLGRGYHLEMNWDEAIRHYTRYKRMVNPQRNPEIIKEVDKLIFECENGKVLVQNPVRVWIDNMGTQVNSPYPDYGMILTADASEIFFTSRQPSTTGGKKSVFDDQYFEDVYTSNRHNSKTWTPARNVGAPINTKGHDAAVALSPDGSKMIVYIDDKGDGNLYESIREGDTWSKPKSFNRAINSKFHEASAWYAPDMKELFFISERPIGRGKEPKDRDIYIAKWNDEKNDWGEIVRLPDHINSEYDEDGIFVHPDGKTIYFSSKGHNSMGGYDVFKAVRSDDGTWSEPVNLGYPINTPDDDVFFTVAANGRDAYMTSYREDGVGDKDLYKITLLGAVKEPIMTGENILLANETTPIKIDAFQPIVEVGGSKLMILKGVVRDSETKQPLRAKIELVDNEKNEVIAEFTSDGQTGRYLVSLPAGKDYGIAVNSEGYLFHSENFNMIDKDGYSEEILDIDLQKVKVGSNIALRNVFFDLSKYSLRDQSIIELNRLVALLNEYPKLKIEISGHTDSRGSATYNKTLSRNRAKAVVDYLVSKGIDKDRLTFEGYGFDTPAISDEEINKMTRETDKEAAHQQNRRTEFKIIQIN